MDDARIPWWLILLLGVTVTGLAIWQSSRRRTQLRLGACALSLIYLAMLAFAIGGDPRVGTVARSWRISDVVSAGLCGVSVAAAVLLVGRPSYRGQLIWFGLMLLMNAGICFVSGLFGIASVLTIVATGILVLVVIECRRGRPLNVLDLWPASKSELNDESPSITWLTGLAGLLLAVSLIGICHYALHAESMRATPTRRHSTIPSRARLQTVLDLRSDDERSIRSLDRFFGRRADVPVLLSVLAFVAIASAMSTWRTQPASAANFDAGCVGHDISPQSSDNSR